MGEALLFCGILAYVAFRNWLHHDRRKMIHRERLAAIEKGIELPAVELEVQKATWNVQRYMLLAGWSWIFIGIGSAIALSVMTTRSLPGGFKEELPPPGVEFAAIIPLGIGIAHLITYWTGERRARRGTEV
jgi:hypothetical protein